MNEATFEARLNGVLRTLFPTVDRLRITHQTTFVLHLGHRKIVIDGKLRDRVGGRLDVLVLVAGRPVILLELKAPGLGLNPDDRQQAMSYARLLQQMPPLFAVSNGQDTRIYTTIDGKPFLATTLDELAIEMLMRDALEAAAADLDAAVRDLLGRNPDLWAQITRQETESMLGALEGDLSDIHAPVCASFAVHRKAAAEIERHVHSGARIVALVGPAMSGRTSVLAQLCRRFGEATPILYIDVSGLSYGIWQHVANLLTERLLRVTTADDARHWLMLSLRDAKDLKFVLAIDGLRSDDSEAVRASVDELVRMTEKSALRLVLALDEDYLDRLSYVPSRATQSRFGRLVKVVPMRALDDEELESAIEALRRDHHVDYYRGVQYSSEIREPRVMRLHLALAQARGPQPTDPAYVVKPPSMATPWLLEQVWEHFAPDPDLRVALKKLATAFVEGCSLETVASAVAFEQHRRASIFFEEAVAILGEGLLERLRAHGFVAAPRRQANRELLLMRVPELLAAAGAHLIASRLLKDADDVEAYGRLIGETQKLPYGEVAGALAVSILGSHDYRRYHELIVRLGEDSPKESVLPEGSRLGVITADGLIPLSLDEEDEQPGMPMGNLHPWLILSHISGGEIRIRDHEFSGNLLIFWMIGNYRSLLRRIETVPLEEMRSFPVHRMANGDEVLCHKAGIVEPLTHAMLQNVLRAPEEMVALAREAARAEQTFLIWRLFLVGTEAVAAADADISSGAGEIVSICGEYWRQKYDHQALHE